MGHALLGLVEAVRAISSGRLAAGEYLSALHERARRLDPDIRAFSIFADDAAWAPDTTPAVSGPLAGIPVAIKDLIDTADLPTAYGSRVYADHVPARDAWVVARLKALGATVMGKTVTTEFAWRHPGPTRNPWNTSRTPGGSSSGSAAAVAAGFVPLALGTQTFGSVIRPAAFCGVVGLKPSFGAIPRTGVHPLSAPLDHIGVFTRHVDDAAFALSLLTGEDVQDRDSRRLPPFGFDGNGLTPGEAPRLALVRTWNWAHAEQEQRDIVDVSAARLAAAGATVEEVELGGDFADGEADARILLAAHAHATLARLLARDPQSLAASTRELIDEGAGVAASRYIEALHRQEVLRHAFTAAVNGFDAVLTPSAAGAAPAGLSWTGDPRFCVLWTYLGVPAVSLPAGDNASGLPLGIQLVGTYRNDLRLLRTAKWCESAIARQVRLPDIVAS